MEVCLIDMSKKKKAFLIDMWEQSMCDGHVTQKHIKWASDMASLMDM